MVTSHSTRSVASISHQFSPVKCAVHHVHLGRESQTPSPGTSHQSPVQSVISHQSPVQSSVLHAHVGRGGGGEGTHAGVG